MSSLEITENSASSAAAMTAATPGMNPDDFFRDHRIMVKDGALFVDPYLVIHPRELDPKNEAALRQKLRLTFTINNPSFYETPERVATALNLGQLLPVSLAAKRSRLLEEVNKFNSEVEAGQDTDLIQAERDKRAPFSAIVRDTLKSPETDPVGLDLLKNGLAMYLLCREKLTQNGYLKPMSSYVHRQATPDQVLADLADKIGATPLQMRDAALRGGLDAVGELLHLDPHYVADVKHLASYAATQDFSYNLVEQWHQGRQILGVQSPLVNKLAIGLESRVTSKIKEFREQVHHHYEVPAPIVKEEQRIAQALELVDPIQRVMLHRLGYELCYSPEMTADDIAFYKGIYGLHRKAANNLRDVNGTYRIYFSGRGDLKGSMRTLVHEVAHNLWPDRFTPQQAAEVDALAHGDQVRFDKLNHLMREHFPQFEKLLAAYHAGNEQEKTAVLAAANQLFAPHGVSVDGLFPHLTDPYRFKFMVQHAHDTLNVEGERYNRSGYNGPEERFREVISRYAELRQVEHRGEPALLDYLAPGLGTIWSHYYLPHLEQVYTQIGPEKPGVPLMEVPVSAPPEEEYRSTAEQGKVKEQAKVEQRPGDPHPAPATLPPAMVEEQGKVKEQAKVEQRPGDPLPKTPAPVAAAAELPKVKEHAAEASAASLRVEGELSSPSSTVQTEGLEHNPQTLAALNALKTMGVDARR